MRCIVVCSFCLLLWGCSAQPSPSPQAEAGFLWSADPHAKPVDKQWHYQDSVERAVKTKDQAASDNSKAPSNVRPAALDQTSPTGLLERAELPDTDTEPAAAVGEIIL